VIQDSVGQGAHRGHRHLSDFLLDRLWLGRRRQRHLLDEKHGTGPFVRG
jgi:hypothetical protein